MLLIGPMSAPELVITTVDEAVARATGAAPAARAAEVEFDRISAITYEIADGHGDRLTVRLDLLRVPDVKRIYGDGWVPRAISCSTTRFSTGRALREAADAVEHLSAWLRGDLPGHYPSGPWPDDAVVPAPSAGSGRAAKTKAEAFVTIGEFTAILGVVIGFGVFMLCWGFDRSIDDGFADGRESTLQWNSILDTARVTERCHGWQYIP